MPTYKDEEGNEVETLSPDEVNALQAENEKLKNKEENNANLRKKVESQEQDLDKSQEDLVLSQKKIEEKVKKLETLNADMAKAKEEKFLQEVSGTKGEEEQKKVMHYYKKLIASEEKNEEEIAKAMVQASILAENAGVKSVGNPVLNSMPTGGGTSVEPEEQESYNANQLDIAEKLGLSEEDLGIKKPNK